MLKRVFLTMVTAATAAVTSICGPAIATDAVGDLAEQLAGHDVIVLGEVHDNPDHHNAQAQLISALKPTAVVFEMLTPEQADIANTTSARGGELAEQLNWANSGWPEWSLYEPIFDAAEPARIHGMALPRDEVRRAVSEGAAAVMGEDADRFGLTDALTDEIQAERTALQRAAHCNALPEDLLGGMVEAQRLRDASFARSILGALDSDGAPVVVIAGTGHARNDWGIPAVLARVAPQVAVVSVGQVESAPDAPLPFDHWLVADPAPRPDPCDAFK